jgi:hypothetical protein
VSYVDFRRIYATIVEGWLGLPSISSVGVRSFLR